MDGSDSTTCSTDQLPSALSSSSTVFAPADSSSNRALSLSFALSRDTRQLELAVAVAVHWCCNPKVCTISNSTKFKINAQLECFHSGSNSASNSLCLLQVQVSSGSPLASSGESRNVSQKRVQRILNALNSERVKT